MTGPAGRTRTGTALSAGLWILVGALGGFGIAAAMTIGIFFLVGAGMVAAVGIVLRADPRNAPLVLSGAAAAPLYIAWLNRHGPGEICRTVDDGVECVQQWSPWPFVVVAGLLVVAGVGLTMLVRRLPRSTTGTVIATSSQ